MVPENFHSPGAYNQLESLYQWYRADNKQSLGSAISGATNKTYTSGDDDVAKYIRGESAAVQDGGLNTTGSYVSSVYTDQIQDDEFNPITAFTWWTAHQPSGGPDLAGVGWVNSGTGTNSVKNGTDNIPTYVPSIGIDFESANAEELVYDQPTPQLAFPVEIWVRFKLESYNASWGYFIAFNGSQYLQQRAGGILYVSGVSTGYTIPLNQWVVARVVISGTTNTTEVYINNSLISSTLNASTTGFGTSNGRLGANAGGTANRIDGLESHWFIKSGKLSDPNAALMWTWFQTYWPYD